MNSLGRIISIILAIILVLFLPLQYIAQSQVETMDHIVETHTHEFTDSVRQKGSITLKDYEEYLNRISQTKELYDIEIEHATPKTLSDLSLNIQEDTRLASNGLTIVPDTLKIDSIDAEIQSFATHTHTDACYDHPDSAVYVNIDVVDNLKDLKSLASNENYFYDINVLHLALDGEREVNNAISALNTLFNSNNVVHINEAHLNFYNYTVLYKTGDLGVGEYTSTIQNRFDMLFEENDVVSELILDEYMAELNGGHKFVVNSASFTEKKNTHTRSNRMYSLASGHSDVNGDGKHTLEDCEVTYIAKKSNYKYNNSSTTTCEDIYEYRCTDTGRLVFSTGKLLGTITNYSRKGWIFERYVNDSFVCFPEWKKLYSLNLTRDERRVTFSDDYGYRDVDQTTLQVNNVYDYVVNGITKPVAEFLVGYDIRVYKTAGGVTTGTSESGRSKGRVGDVNQSFEASSAKNEDISSELIHYRSGNFRFGGVYTQTLNDVKYLYENGKKYYTYMPGTDDNKTKAIFITEETFDIFKREVLRAYPNVTTRDYSFAIPNSWEAVQSGEEPVLWIGVEQHATITDPMLTGISVFPSLQSIERYQKPSFTVNTHYEDGSSKPVTSFTQSGLDNSKIGTQMVTISYSENGITKTATAKVNVTTMTKVCPDCGTRYQLDNDIDNGCPNCSSTITKIEATPDLVTVNQGSILPITVYALYKNGGSSIINNWTSNYDPLKIGYQQVTINYKGFKDYITVEVKASKKICSICENEYNLNEDGSDPGCPICSTTIIGIKAEPNPIIIELHQPLNIRVTATFKDGHTELVNGWTSDMVPDKPGTYNVTILYKSVTDQITVRIIDDDLTECPYCGISFSRSKHPNGCPECSVTLIGIEASLRNGGTTVIKGSKLDLEIELKYRDTHREVTYEGYTVSNYHPDLVGEQIVIVKYKEFQQNLIVEVIDTFGKTTCPNGHVYHLNEDGSDPGCPYCIDYGDREKLVVYYDTTYTTKIVETLYNQNIYSMKAGDYITIIVTKKNRSLRAQIINIFSYNKAINNTITYGGEVIG